MKRIIARYCRLHTEWMGWFQHANTVKVQSKGEAAVNLCK